MSILDNLATLSHLYAARTHVQQGKAALFEMSREISHERVSQLLNEQETAKLGELSISIREAENLITGLIQKAEQEAKTSNLENSIT